MVFRESHNGSVIIQCDALKRTQSTLKNNTCKRITATARQDNLQIIPHMEPPSEEKKGCETLKWKLRSELRKTAQDRRQ